LVNGGSFNYFTISIPKIEKQKTPSNLMMGFNAY